ncbi:peroxiredoxin [Thiomicrorhabdus xiamenensis]|uniref:thioredoxin-dependent peroxiredoxin n=1 Tax=Thiomicrorhabdus xiamenensis TaxID=2739063 RepID=A0A7D4NP90_9GAMM|nr:peroxiredoxin [Thiomicrorhabdus xiamenensis]QKI89433.1 peroxiredoxin [Thiomicrorhabdus xiamenensis]
MMAKIGDRLPQFSLQATNERTLSEQDFIGRYSVLYFYPKDSTPGCTTEGLDFTALHNEFAALDAQIFGISMDSMRRHENFKDKQGFTFDLISDPEAELCQALGVYQLKKNFGKEYMGIVRSTFLIDPEGKVAALWSPVKVKGHAEEVLQTLKQML